MRFLSAEHTDVGIRKQVNQDGLLLKIVQYGDEQLAFALLCDGMGGLSDGEIASNTVLRAFLDWFSETLPAILEEGQLTNERISRDWSQIAQAQNQQIGRYAAKRGIHMGTTATALLLAFGHYYVMNVGDKGVWAAAAVLCSGMGHSALRCAGIPAHPQASHHLSGYEAVQRHAQA